MKSIKNKSRYLYGDRYAKNSFILNNEGVFLKDFKTIDEQIALLKSRGLSIPNDAIAKRYLLTNNYYNIINGYSKYFCSSPNVYHQGTTFDEVSNLYFFDKEIKRAFFQAILEAEGHLKSILAYRFAEAYQNKKYAYLDINCYDNSKILDVSYITSKLYRILNNNKKLKNGNSIAHYHKTYGDVPIWVIVDYLEFGDIVSLLENLPVSIQNKIALDLMSFIKENISNSDSCVFTPEQLVSFIKNIREIRNICAHNNRLLGFKCRADSRYFPELHSKHFENSDERRDAYAAFISLKCFISKIEFAKLNNTIRKRIQRLDNQLTSISTNEVISHFGFPEDWHKLPTLPQS